MLNSLDAVKKAIDDGLAAAKKAGDTASQQELEAIATERQTVFSSLTADYHNDEDGIEMPGKVREDVQGIAFFGGAVVTPAVRDYVRRVVDELRAATQGYDRFKAQQLPALNRTLDVLKIKAVSM
jgi:hypothetical protein